MVAKTFSFCCWVDFVSFLIENTYYLDILPTSDGFKDGAIESFKWMNEGRIMLCEVLLGFIEKEMGMDPNFGEMTLVKRLRRKVTVNVDGKVARISML